MGVEYDYAAALFTAPNKRPTKQPHIPQKPRDVGLCSLLRSPFMLVLGQWREQISAISPNIERMGDPSQYFLHDHRDLTFMTLSLISSTLAVTQTSTLVPGAIALAIFHVYSRFLFPSYNARQKSVAFMVAIAVGSASTNLTASREALDSKAMAFFVLSALYLLTSAIVVGILFVDWHITRRYPLSSTSLFWFPAMWATMWRLTAYVSPVGNLLTWYRPTVVEGYRWLVPLLGPGSQDWITAAWAVVLSQTFQFWFMGPKVVEDDEEELEHDSARRATRKRSFPAAPMLGFGLAALLLPSFIGSSLPRPVADVEDTTPLAVGCILPPYQRYKRHQPSFDDYINESKKYRSMARLLLWPEGAVTFDNEKDREEGFARIRKEVPGVYIGVSFEQWLTDPNGEKVHKQTGLAVLSHESNDTYLTYWKQHLVPIAESYRLASGNEPPTISNISLVAPKEISSPKWDPSPSHRRSLSITASICLDFAFPEPFRNLDARPGLILAPARTWERSVGISMWLQAKQRAIELDSMVLWCDGGSGGVSGIGGGGFEEFNQVGSGSWVRTIGVEYPFNDKQTVYARFEDWTVLMYWLVAAGFALKLPVSGSFRFVFLK
ncbi:hypothetical protein BKA70DRAFT_317300 [Coprinopsis sp. MPI-PUGE-AT-0042]|nr:hypothetical protein BKA70DRAFT_317300 [Coprinopsis sp. MPI-PUGE-AT-0042]